MKIKKSSYSLSEIVLTVSWAVASFVLIALGFSIWLSSKTLDECGSLPLSAYTSPDDTTPAKCYAMWKDGRL